MLWRSGPNNKTIPLIDESRINIRVFKSQEVLVNGKFLELIRDKLLPLLGIPLCPVDRIKGLYFFL